MSAIPVEGNRVAFSAKWLKSVQADKVMADRRGTILTISNALASVKWDDCDEPKSALLGNLVRADRINLEPV